jgi:methanogenic corrinoid protein MtbC1
MLKKEIFPIKVVAQRTGLTEHVIRMWEKRYKAVSPSRNNTNQRFYNAEEINRLLLLNQAIQSGFSIGHVAQLTDQELLSITQKGSKNQTNTQTRNQSKTNIEDFLTKSSKPCLEYVEECLLALSDIDAHKLDQILTKAQIEFSPLTIIESLIVPLLNKIGILWQEGKLRIVQEHLATVVIRTFLGRLQIDLRPPVNAPKLITTTLSGQFHELGALIVAVVAAYEGWKVICLGANLPVEELAKAIEQHQCSVVCLSIVYPSDDPYLHLELKKLRKLVGKKVTFLVGGQAAIAYKNTLASIDADLIQDLTSLRIKLSDLNNPSYLADIC